MDYCDLTEGLTQIKKSVLVILLLCSAFLICYLPSSAKAQVINTPTTTHMQSALLPNALSESSYQKTVLPARYDQQLGITFVEDFVSLAYNVTAVDQIDEYGYGPAYLLNGLSDQGYWYQVGLSFNWPYSGISGYNQGFAFNYQVFAPNQSSVYPASGGGGLQPFSGPVNPGDKVLLVLSIYQDSVIMYAEDSDTGAYSFQVFSAEGARYFEGSPYTPANSNGFFTGLMTEWYHPQPYFKEHSKVTYSNDAFELSAAWMWMDEYDPSNGSWTGAWFTNTAGPIDFSQNSTQLNTLSFGDITESCNSNRFTTGSIVPLQTSITLLPAYQAVSLSGVNNFEIQYVLRGRQMVTYASGGALYFNADNRTSVFVSGISSGSTSAESWVLNSNASNVTLTAGSTATFVYYDLLPQHVSFTISDGENPPDATFTYYTAPEIASTQQFLERNDLSLPLNTYRTIMVARGSTTSIQSSISNSPKERWALTNDSSWIITAANQIPPRVNYQHQFLLSFAGLQMDWKWVNAGTITQVIIPGVLERNEGSGQRVTSYTIDDGTTIIQPTTKTVAIPVLMNSPHQISINLVKQVQVSLNASIAKNVMYITPPTIAGDTCWYDQGTAVKLMLKSVLDRVSGEGERLESYSISGVVTNVADANPITTLDLNAILSPEAISGKNVKQYQINVANGSLASISNPPIQGDVGWYDSESIVNAVFNYSWNYTQDRSRTSAIGYAINESEIIFLNRLGNGTFQVQITMFEPQNVSVYSAAQNVLDFSGGFNIQLSHSSPTQDSFYDADTAITLTTESTWKLTNESINHRVTGYIVDGTEITFNETGTATFTTSTIYLDKPHELIFNSIESVPSNVFIFTPTTAIAVIAIITTFAVFFSFVVMRRRRSKSG